MIAAWLLAGSLLSDHPLYYELRTELHRRELEAWVEAKTRTDEAERCEACDPE